MKIKNFKNVDAMFSQCVNVIRETLNKNTIISIGFSGGKTPIKLFKMLALAPLHWERIHIFLVDERNVPLNHMDSNYYNLKINLLDKIHIPKKNIHHIYYFENPKDSQTLYEKNLKEFFKKNISFDIIFLGMGSDGHTASLFSKEDLNKKEVVVTTSSPNHSHNRISLGINTINNSKRNILLLTRDKIPTFENINSSNKPITYVKHLEVFIEL